MRHRNKLVMIFFGAVNSVVKFTVLLKLVLLLFLHNMDGKAAKLAV